MEYVRDSFIGKFCIVYVRGAHGEFYEYARGRIINYRLGQVIVSFTDGMISPWISIENIAIIEFGIIE